MKKLTITMSCYEQPLMMAEQIKMWHRYTDDILDNISIVIVDDGSQKNPFNPGDADLPPRLDLKIYRVVEDIPWNQMGARNLAMHFDDIGWAMFIDPDMLIQPETLGKVLFAPQFYPSFKIGSRYMFDLKVMPGGRIDDTSPNCYIIHRRTFHELGCHDEDYAGHKGWSDVQFHRICAMAKVKTHRLGLTLDFIPPDMIPDAAVTILDRSVEHNRVLHSRKIREIAAIGVNRWVARKRKQPRPYLRFTWERVR